MTTLYAIGQVLAGVMVLGFAITVAWVVYVDIIRDR